MDNSDEESQNSSEMSFNEVVTIAMAAGIAIWNMLQVPTQGNPYVLVPEPTGRQWVEILLSDAGRCYETAECGLKIWLGCIAYYMIAMA